MCVCVKIILFYLNNQQGTKEKMGVSELPKIHRETNAPWHWLSHASGGSFSGTEHIENILELQLYDTIPSIYRYFSARNLPLHDNISQPNEPVI